MLLALLLAVTPAVDAVVADAQTCTLPGLGAAQGVARRGGKIYIYGDVTDARPRVGVIREYDGDLQPTGRVVWLRRDDRPVITHPTGLTWHPELGCFLGDTVAGRSTIYHLDWDRALSDGDLNHAVRAVIRDDAAINGGRPEFVRLRGRPLLATADYGDQTPQIRLYDVEKMLAAGRTSADGVVVRAVAAGPFNQTLSWDAGAGELTCVQNVTAGRGWRLDVIDLAKAADAGRADAGRVRTLTFPNADELEGYCPLGDGRSLFVTAMRRDNATVGVIRVPGRD